MDRLEQQIMQHKARLVEEFVAKQIFRNQEEWSTLDMDTIKIVEGDTTYHVEIEGKKVGQTLEITMEQVDGGINVIHKTLD